MREQRSHQRKAHPWLTLILAGMTGMLCLLSIYVYRMKSTRDGLYSMLFAVLFFIGYCLSVHHNKIVKNQQNIHQYDLHRELQKRKNSQ